MNTFFYDGMKLLEENVLDRKDISHFLKIKKTYESLERVYANFRLNPPLDNIESLFSLIDMGSQVSRFPEISNMEELGNLKSSIMEFIVRTIELKSRFIMDKRDKAIISPDLYNLFFEAVIDRLILDWDKINCSIITFNYDVALDFVLESRTDGVNYCFDELPKSNYVKLMKLHGSINWGVCKECMKTQIYRIRSAYVLSRAVSSSPIEISTKMQCDSCKERLNPLLVPPTWNKTESEDLKHVWKMAAKEISEAKKIIVIGYSLPLTDLFFPYLLALGMINILVFDGFWVFDPNQDTLNRFENLMGPKIKNNKKFYPKKMEFGEAILEIRDSILE